MSHPEITLRAELDGVRRDPLVSLPVIPPERIPDFQREWYRRPELRALIRTAGQLEEAEVAHSPTVRALWELAHSDAWAADARGLFCDYPEFAALFHRRPQ